MVKVRAALRATLLVAILPVARPMMASLVLLSADAAVHQGMARAASARFQIAPQPLALALETYVRLSNREVLYDSELASGRRSAEVDGVYTPEVALQILLAGTGLSAEVTDESYFVLRRAAPDLVQHDQASESAADRLYYGRVQQALRQAFCKPGIVSESGRFVARLWIGPSGDVLQAKGIAEGSDGAVQRALRGMTIGAPPPPGFGQPITVLVLPPTATAGRDCDGPPSPTASRP